MVLSEILPKFATEYNMFYANSNRIIIQNNYKYDEKTFITILLAVLMSMVGTKTFAHDIEVVNSDGVTIYYVWMNNNTELAVSYKGSTYESYNNEYSGNVVIPSSVEYNGNSYSVTSIGGSAFGDCTDLTSVTIPDGVTSIEKFAFLNCSSLTSVTIPNSVTTFGESAFYNCTGLTSIEFPNSVTEIDGGAFSGCIGLTSITIPNSVTYIGDEAFYQVDKSDMDYSNLTAVISLIENPFKIESTVFTKTTFKNATLYVPEGTKDKYMSTEGWKDFVKIEEGTPAGINNFNQEIPTIVRYYNLSGQENVQSRKGINILKMSDGKTKKVFVK